MHLTGRTIIDCSMLLPGPRMGKLLLDRGARVIKIENPERPDPAREIGAFYSDLNDRKELVFLNLTKPDDRNSFYDLVKKADGLIEGFRPSAKLKLGLGEEILHTINPRLCIASIVGYPENGPSRDRAGHDINFEAVTGALSLFNEMPALPLGDFFCAYEGALSLIAALDAVSRGGPQAKGSRVVVCISEILKNAQSGLIRDFQLNGSIPKHGETLFSGRFPCYRVYRAQDGRRIAVGAIEKKFWHAVCEILDIQQYAREGFATGSWGQEVIDAVQEKFAARPWSDWEKIFSNANCCVEPVLEYPEIYGL